VLIDGEMSNLQFLEITQNFTYKPDRDSLHDGDGKENDTDGEPKRKRRRVEIPRDSDSDSLSD
jgi:hypothetical protein